MKELDVILDKYRDEFMRSLGVQTLRFDNHEVLREIDNVILKIETELLEKE